MNRQIFTKSSKKIGVQQCIEWKQMVLSVLFKLWILGFLLALFLYIFFNPNEECSRQLYFQLFVLKPTVAHGVVLGIVTILFERIAKRNNVLAMSLTTIAAVSLFAGIIVCVHTSVAFMPVLLLLPIALAPLYGRKWLMFLQLGLSAMIYVVDVFYFIPHSVYMPPGSQLIDVTIFTGSGLALVFIIEQINVSIVLRDEKAMRDSLTHLYNHESFYEELEHRMDIFEQKKTKFSILIADIDKFKQVNDTYGHAFGDEVICQVAATMEMCSNRTIFCARYGGEEFAMIMPGKNLLEAKLLAESVRREFEKHDFVTEEGQTCRFTLSIGVAEYYGDIKKASQFFEEADKALYEAKRTGRNKVCVSEREIEPVAAEIAEEKE